MEYKWRINWMQTQRGGNGVYFSNAKTLEEAIKECKRETMYNFLGELIRPDLKITDIYIFVQYGE